MEKKKKWRPYHLKFAMVLIVLLLVSFALFRIDSQTYHLPLYNGTRAYHEEHWRFGEKGGDLEAAELGDQRMIESGKTYVLTTTLTYNGDGDAFPSAFITIGNYESEIYLDGELMFRYTRQERGYPMVQGLGGANVSIPLGENCGGKELRLELRSPMRQDRIRRLPGIQLGDHSAQMQDLFAGNLSSMLISGAIVFVFVVLVMLGGPSDEKRLAYLYFSIFACLIVVYRAMQDLFLLYTWGNPFLAVMLEFFSMVVCPIPMLLSYRYELRPHFSGVFNWMIGLSTVNLLVQLFCHFTGILDVVDFLEVTHLWILICAVFLVGSCIYVDHLEPERHAMRKLTPILVGAVLDFLVFYIRFHTIGAGSFFSIGNYIGLGLLVSLSIMVWEARKEREQSYADLERNALLEKLAYRDALTGIENRAGFTKAISEFQAGQHRGASVRAVAADLNDLKKTNDNLGHGAGDELIRRAASLLSDSFRAYGHVYRTGGDEFFALLYGVSDAQWEQLYDRFLKGLENTNRETELKLSIALGAAEMTDGIDQCIQLADKRMYQNKQQIKQMGSYGFSADT